MKRYIANILQIGDENLKPELLDENIKWEYLDISNEDMYEELDAIKEINYYGFSGYVITSKISLEQLKLIDNEIKIEEYKVFNLNSYQSKETLDYLRYKYHVYDMPDNDVLSVTNIIFENFFNQQYGDRMKRDLLKVSASNETKVQYFGHNKIQVDTMNNYDKTYISWGSHYLYVRENVMELWLEYELYGDIKIQLEISLTTAINDGNVETILLSDTDMIDPFLIGPYTEGKTLSFRVILEGNGSAVIGNLHFRQNRGSYGQMLPGGERLVNASREELFVYYNQGNLKPPLNVYFSGYRTAEGFEGYPMMRSLDHPFILIGDPRLEGGEFYRDVRGDLEEQLVNFIDNKLEELNLNRHDLNLMGLSMGTTGAIYYSNILKPGNVIIGKPLVNLKGIAENSTVNRTEDFLTALDIQKDMNIDNEDFITQNIKLENIKNTTFYVIYMEQDDYDNRGFYKLKELFDGHINLIGKGFEGRHNDESSKVVEWFLIYTNDAMKKWEDGNG